MNNQLLSCIMRIAKLMVSSGAEIYRVEESVSRICRAYGVERADVYATTSQVMVTVEMPDYGILTHSGRIRRIANHVERVDRLNDLVRYMTAYTPDAEEVEKRLEEVQRTRSYSRASRMLSFGLIAGTFCLFFGGRGIAETLLAAAIGCLLGICTVAMEELDANKLLIRFVCAFLASVLAFLGCRAGLAEQVDYIIIGNIMTLIPGVGLTNALRDLFTGDNLSGALRLIEAVLMAFVIAAGYLLGSWLMGGAV